MLSRDFTGGSGQGPASGLAVSQPSLDDIQLSFTKLFAATTLHSILSTPLRAQYSAPYSGGILTPWTHAGNAIETPQSLRLYGCSLSLALKWPSRSGVHLFLHSPSCPAFFSRNVSCRTPKLSPRGGLPDTAI